MKKTSQKFFYSSMSFKDYNKGVYIGIKLSKSNKVTPNLTWKIRTSNLYKATPHLHDKTVYNKNKHTYNINIQTIIDNV